MDTKPTTPASAPAAHPCGALRQVINGISWRMLLLFFILVTGASTVAGFINLRNAKPLAANTPAAISIAGPLDDFARCLTSRKAVMYGAYWCPHCQNQKKLFGPSFGLVTYVECAAASGQAPACEEAGIKSYPTWVFDSGKQELGQLSLKELSDKTSCPL